MYLQPLNQYPWCFWGHLQTHVEQPETSCPMHTFLDAVERRGPQPPGLRSHTGNKLPPRVLSAEFLTFLCFLLVTLLFKMASECPAEVLCNVSSYRYKKTLMQYVTEKKHALGRPLTWVMTLLTLSSALINRRYTSSVFKLTHIRIALTSCSQCDQRLIGKSLFFSLMSSGLVFANSVFVMNL